MIPSLPSDLGIVAAENAVFRRHRSNLPMDETLGEYSNAAQIVLGYFQSIESQELHALYDPQKAAEVIAAGRILDAASAELLRKSEISDSSEDLRMAVATGLLATMANAFYGNFPAATTIARRFKRIETILNPLQICALCCSAPDYVGHFLPLVRGNAVARTFLESLEAFLRTGETSHEAKARASFRRLRELLDSAFDHSVWMSCEVCFEQLVKLCIAKILPGLLGASSQHYVTLLAKAGLRTFLPPQFLALIQDNLLGNSGNAIICLPTSTGKTFLSELCIYSAVHAQDRIGVFVIPYVALGRQIADRVSHHLPDDWKVVRLFGGFKEPNAFVSDGKKLFVVATPERVDAMLRFTPDILTRIDCVVFDEAHMIENGQRGARLEGLIARFLLAQDEWGVGRLVIVSAVIPNVTQIAHWVGAEKSSVVSHLWAPSSRRLAIWKSDGRLVWYHGVDPVSPKGSAPDSQIASVQLPWPNRIVPTHWDFQEGAFFEDKNYENLVYLCYFMWDREKEPVLCVCANRETTRRTAAILGRYFDAIEPTLPETQKIITLIATKYPHYRHLKQALAKGVAYHNASLPHDLRAAIEDAAWAKELRCVVSTTTLAEGIDLPFRVTILADWLRYKGKMQVPYSPLLVRNIAGRCGRAGYFTEGDIVIYDNPLGDRKYKAPGLKEEWQQRIFFAKGDVGVQSAMNIELEDATIQASVASQFLAAVAENPRRDNIEEDFAVRLLSGSSSLNTGVKRYVSSVTDGLLSQDFLLATRNSPITLTHLGIAVNQSGFCPSSCRQILSCLRHISGEMAELSLAAFLLTELGDLPEQGDHRFTKLVEREKYNRLPSTLKKMRPPKTYVRIELLPSILKDWVEGKQPIEIFGSLSTVLRSSIRPPFAAWLEGIDEVTAWDSEFDKFSDFLSATVFEFLPWLLRACSLLAPHSNPDGTFQNWQGLAEMFQRDSTITRREDTTV